MAEGDLDTDELIRRAATGDDQAKGILLVRSRPRLRQLIAVRLDRRLQARIDPSDVVQEVLTEAHQKFSSYVHEQPVPFYAWLRAMAWQRLIKLHQYHHARRRGISREVGGPLALPDESAHSLARILVTSATSPSKHLLREEERRRVRSALAALGENDREVLVLRYLEQLTVREMAAVLGIKEGAVKTRHARALVRLQAILGEEDG
jgi:RNA polymerase sigma-70 factor (ECF subfamily)